MKRTPVRIALALAIGAGITIAVVKAQQAPPAERKIVLRKDTAVAGREAIMATVDLAPGSTEGRHIHPSAEVYVFVLEGTPTIEIAGQPARTLKPGDYFSIAPGQIHEGRNRSQAPAKFAAVFFAEKGKPLAEPAP